MAYELPETIEGLSVEELDTQIDSALDALQALNITDESSDEDLDSGEAISVALETLRAAKAEAIAAVEAKAERVAALQAQAAEQDEAEDEAVAETEDEPEVAEEPVAAAAEAPEASEVVTPEEVTETQEVEAVAASADNTPSPVARAAAAAPEVVVPEKQTAALIAAADVPGYGNGQELEGLRAATKAVLARTKGLPRQNLATERGGVRQRYGAALIQKMGLDSDFVQTEAESTDMDLLWRATNDARLPGGSLVAAGGWCAPSETLYDLCQYETLEGILSLPEFQVNRGGIRYTQGPSFDDIYNACGFIQTEAEAIAGDCKDCCSVECPDFDEIRLDAIGLCVKSPILTESAYPELVQRFIEGALVAHAHKVNKYILDSMLMAAGTPVVATEAGSLSITLEGLVYTAIGMRYSYRLSTTAAIEVVAPYWLKELVRIDLAIENGRDSKNVGDAEIDGWFAARNMSVQWVYDFQDPSVSDCEVTIPDEATVLMYPAGTWAKGTTDVINLDAVYDSPNLEANQYTALFVEEGILAVQKCTHTCAVTIPICVSGKGVADDIDICMTAPVAPTQP